MSQSATGSLRVRWGNEAGTDDEMELIRNEVKTNWLFIIYQGKSLADLLEEQP